MGSMKRYVSRDPRVQEVSKVTCGAKSPNDSLHKHHAASIGGYMRADGERFERWRCAAQNSFVPAANVPSRTCSQILAVASTYSTSRRLEIQPCQNENPKPDFLSPGPNRPPLPLRSMARSSPSTSVASSGCASASWGGGIGRTSAPPTGPKSGAPFQSTGQARGTRTKSSRRGRYTLSAKRVT